MQVGIVWGLAAAVMGMGIWALSVRRAAQQPSAPWFPAPLVSDRGPAARPLRSRNPMPPAPTFIRPPAPRIVFTPPPSVTVPPPSFRPQPGFPADDSARLLQEQRRFEDDSRARMEASQRRAEESRLRMDEQMRQSHQRMQENLDRVRQHQQDAMDRVRQGPGGFGPPGFGAPPPPAFPGSGPPGFGAPPR